MKTMTYKAQPAPGGAGESAAPQRAGRSGAVRRLHQRALPVIGVTLLTPLLLLAADCSINWSTIDGGGGTSTGGVYAVGGTIGQPDASGPMTNGQYSVVGGFWAVVAAVQTPGAPTLSVTRTPTNTVVVSWPLPDAGWKLQATTKLVASGSLWTELTPPYATNATSLYFVEPTPVGNQFYRLHKP